eukprot:TRINITY_DN26167_c0_g1_i1.p1 TRINITY_DN26167_c0_g1~~TRINITY_DN26167_c0_g1_i1.p1  ORF type:complete len:272 (-),score=58.95 TRINITY_DN26167_c0_g1_i1:81-896(-)
MENKAKLDKPFGTWEEGDASLYWVRGASYEEDNEKIPATGPVFRLVHLDLFQGPKEELHIFPRVRHLMIPNMGLENKERQFYFIMNFIVRGKDKSIDKKNKCESWINWVFYFALPRDARKNPENENFFKCYDAFLKGDEKVRNHRVKAILCVVEGPWIVKATIGGGKDGTHKGATPTLVGEKVTTTYWSGEDYIEVDYNTAIDAIAVNSAKLAFQHSQKLVVDLGIVLQAETSDEQPEKILGCVRCSYFVIKKADLFPGTTKETYKIKQKD